MSSHRENKQIVMYDHSGRPVGTHGEVSPTDPRVIALVRQQAPPTGAVRGCKNCRHRLDRRCGHPSFGRKELDFFTGEVLTKDRPSCREMRQGGACGPEGRLWDRTPPHRRTGVLAGAAATSVATSIYLGAVMQMGVPAMACLLVAAFFFFQWLIRQ